MGGADDIVSPLVSDLGGGDGATESPSPSARAE
jgi:hypothetical protein